MNSIRKTLFSALLFLLFYVQPISIAGTITISILTQVIVFTFCVYRIISFRRHSFGSTDLTNLLWGVKPIISPAFFSSHFFSAMQDAFKYSLFGIFHLYFKSAFRNVGTLTGLSVYLSSFFILSSLPYLTGIIDPIGREYELEIYGADTQGFTGLFFNAHCASTIISICCLNLLYYIYINPNRKFSKSIYKIILILGIYVLYKTYIRTGYVMFLGGVLVYALTRFKIQYIAQYILITILITIVSWTILENDQVLYNRIFDKFSNSENNNAINNIGSGRLLFQLKAMEIWNTNSDIEQILGIGTERLPVEMNKKVGLKIMTHSGFFDALLKEGVIGLALFVTFLVSILLYIWRHKRSNFFVLNLSTYISYVFFQFVQGGVIFPMIEFMIALNLAILHHDVLKHKQIINARKSTFNIN